MHQSDSPATSPATPAPRPEPAASAKHAGPAAASTFSTFRTLSSSRTPARLQRTGLVAALLLGLTGALSGAATAAPASAAGGSSSMGSGQHAQPHVYGNGNGSSHGHGNGNRNSHGNGRTVDYVAFGDSYAAGYGGGTLLDACGRTAEGYPALLDALPRVELDSYPACAGATALTTPPAPPQGPVDLPEQISTAVAADLLNRQTDLVTVTIGGNDVQFGAVVAACAGPALPETCAPAIAAAQSYAAAAVVPQLQASFAEIRKAAPRAELVMAGYPHLFEATVPGPLSIEAQKLFNAGTDELNALLAARMGDGTFVDVTAAFAGHGIGSPDSWIILAGGPFDLHPTAAGYRNGYFAAITAAVDVTRLGDGGRGHCRGRG